MEVTPSDKQSQPVEFPGDGQRKDGKDNRKKFKASLHLGG
jgi:hypothetical protein